MPPLQGRVGRCAASNIGPGLHVAPPVPCPRNSPLPSSLEGALTASDHVEPLFGASPRGRGSKGEGIDQATGEATRLILKRDRRPTRTVAEHANLVRWHGHRRMRR
jgi:hypothetical protein